MYFEINMEARIKEDGKKQRTEYLAIDEYQLKDVIQEYLLNRYPPLTSIFLDDIKLDIGLI